MTIKKAARFYAGWHPSRWLPSGWISSGWLRSGWLTSGWLRSEWLTSGWLHAGWLTSKWLRPGWLASGWLVAALLAGNGALWAVMFFGTLAHLQALAGGAAPFDIRPLGYSYEEARSFLEAIGEQGRAYYFHPELILDTVYPPFYALSRGLALWWLTMPGRLYDGPVPQRWRWTLVAFPVVMAICDSVENVSIAKMLWSWPDLSPGLVQVSSLATRVKFLAGVFTEILMAALAIAALLRWQRLPRQHAVPPSSRPRLLRAATRTGAGPGPTSAAAESTTLERS